MAQQLFQTRKDLAQELRQLLQDPYLSPNHRSILHKLSHFDSLEFNEKKDLDRGGKQPVTSYLGRARWSQPASEGYSGRVVDIIQVLREFVGANDTIVDVGSGYGRFIALAALAFPKAQFYGLEIVPERVTGSKILLENLGLTNASAQLCDVSHPGASLPKADQYYLYWALNQASFEYLIQRIEREELTQKIILRYNRVDDEWPRFLRKRGWKIQKRDVDLFEVTRA